MENRNNHHYLNQLIQKLFIGFTEYLVEKNYLDFIHSKNLIKLRIRKKNINFFSHKFSHGLETENLRNNSNQGRTCLILLRK